MGLSCKESFAWENKHSLVEISSFLKSSTVKKYNLNFRYITEKRFRYIYKFKIKIFFTFSSYENINLAHFLRAQNERTSSSISHFWPTVLVVTLKNVFLKIKNLIFLLKYIKYGKNYWIAQKYLWNAWIVCSPIFWCTSFQIPIFTYFNIEFFL